MPWSKRFENTEDCQSHSRIHTCLAPNIFEWAIRDAQGWETESAIGRVSLRKWKETLCRGQGQEKICRYARGDGGSTTWRLPFVPGVSSRGNSSAFNGLAIATNDIRRVRDRFGHREIIWDAPEGPEIKWLKGWPRVHTLSRAYRYVRSPNNKLICCVLTCRLWRQWTTLSLGTS